MESFRMVGVFVGTTAVVVLAIEGGYRLGRRIHRSSADEKESPVSAITGTILGLLAFMLALTFAIVSDRYDARKALVRDEANAIRTAYLRADFLPETVRGEAVRLLRRYVDIRLAAVQSARDADLPALLSESTRIQKQLWEMAVVNARLDMNSDVAALYLESLNDVSNFHALRIAVGLQARIPPGIWLVLYSLLFLGMTAVGYQTAIADSRRSWAAPILAISFALVIALIAALDHPRAGYITVSQQPLQDLQSMMVAGSKDAARVGDDGRRSMSGGVRGESGDWRRTVLAVP